MGKSVNLQAGAFRQKNAGRRIFDIPSGASLQAGQVNIGKTEDAGKLIAIPRVIGAIEIYRITSAPDIGAGALLAAIATVDITASDVTDNRAMFRWL